MIQLYKNCLTSTVVLPKISQGTSDARITIKCILNSHGVHQLPNYLSEYMVVAYQKMQNDERVLKIYISIISVYENREINAKNRENAPREAKN